MKRLIFVFITIYQQSLSFILPKSCRFYPSCSEYAKECLKKFGILKGLLRSIFRILRCNPFSQGGYDPV